MEKINEIISIINSTGFPIFCVLALGWYIKSCLDKLEVTIADMRLVIEKNTMIIDKLCEHIDKE